MLDIRKTSSSEQFRRHASKSRKISRQSRNSEVDTRPKRSILAPLRPRAVSTPHTEATSTHPPLRLAQLARQHSFAMHVENWRDDMIAVQQYLPMQQIINSLEHDEIGTLAAEYRSSRSWERTKTSNIGIQSPPNNILEESSIIDPRLGLFDFHAPQAKWEPQDWTADSRHDVHPLSTNQFARDWYSLDWRSSRENRMKSILLGEDPVCSDEAEAATLSEEFEKYVDYQEPGELCKAKL